MEDYKKNYEDSMKKIEHLYESVNPECKQIIEYYFPELKESEDERIRKEIIQFLQLPHSQFVGKRNHEKWISWLEKQGEQKSAWSEEDEYNLNWIINDYERASQTAISSVWDDSFKMIVNWLKSLKERLKGE